MLAYFNLDLFEKHGRRFWVVLLLLNFREAHLLDVVLRGLEVRPGKPKYAVHLSAKRARFYQTNKLVEDFQALALGLYGKVSQVKLSFGQLHIRVLILLNL